MAFRGSEFERGDILCLRQSLAREWQHETFAQMLAQLLASSAGTSGNQIYVLTHARLGDVGVKPAWLLQKEQRLRRPRKTPARPHELKRAYLFRAWQTLQMSGFQR